jgi:hypothetical protein
LHYTRYLKSDVANDPEAKDLTESRVKFISHVTARINDQLGRVLTRP